jgi:hypothetical protein
MSETRIAEHTSHRDMNVLPLYFLRDAFLATRAWRSGCDVVYHYFSQR